MDITLEQASYYELVFPITINGETPEELNEAQMSIFRGSTEIAAFTLTATEISFANGNLTVIIDNADSLELVGAYTYELWVTDILDNNLYCEGGTLTFNRTFVRL